MSTTLGSVCTFSNGGTPSKIVSRYFDGDIPWITGADIAGPRVQQARSFITEEAIRESATNQVPAGTVLLVTRTSVGKVAVAGMDLCFSQDITAITPNPEKLETGYLVQFLRTKEQHLERLARGATIKGVTREIIADLPIPLPPLPEQRRIAEVLDRAEALRTKRRAALAQIDALTQSIFLDMFGDPAANPKGWPRKPIGEIGKVITGNTPPRTNEAFYGTTIEWIKSDNLNTPNSYPTEATERLSQAGKATTRTVPKGSILVTCIAGTPSCIGNAAITDREVAFNQQINALVPFHGDFRFIYVQMLVGKKLIQRASTASMKGMVSKSRFEQVLLTVPPLDLQSEFARRFVAIENLRVEHYTSLSEMDALFSALQNRAFQGEL